MATLPTNFECPYLNHTLFAYFPIITAFYLFSIELSSGYMALACTWEQ